MYKKTIAVACLLGFALSGALFALSSGGSNSPMAEPEFILSSVSPVNAQMPYGMTLASDVWLTESVSSPGEGQPYRILFFNVTVLDSTGTTRLARMAGPLVVEPTSSEVLSSPTLSVSPENEDGEPVSMTFKVLFAPKSVSNWGEVRDKSEIEHIPVCPAK
jgi:hypothetical protein